MVKPWSERDSVFFRKDSDGGLIGGRWKIETLGRTGVAHMVLLYQVFLGGHTNVVI